MSRNKHAKARMKLTGESYQQALQAIRQGGGTAPNVVSVADPANPPPKAVQS